MNNFNKIYYHLLSKTSKANCAFFPIYDSCKYLSESFIANVGYKNMKLQNSPQILDQDLKLKILNVHL